MSTGSPARLPIALPAAALVLALASCAPLSLYYRPGVSVSRMQSDTTQCQVKALGDAPVANQIRQTPPIYYPGTQYCDGAGNCVYRPGYWVGGNIYTVDVNAPLRRRVQDMCMASRGYQPVSIPRCPSGVESRVAPGQTSTLPRLTQSSCAVIRPDGSWQIVNRG